MGIDDITSRKSFPVNPTSVREEESKKMGILILGSYLTACIPPGDLALLLKAAAKNMLWCIFHLKLSVLINCVCADEALNQIGLFCSHFYHKFLVCPWKSNESLCAWPQSLSAKQRRDHFATQQHGKKFCASWDGEVPLYWVFWKKRKQIDTGQIQSALKLTIWFIRKQILQFRNYQEQSFLLGLLITQMS